MDEEHITAYLQMTGWFFSEGMTVAANSANDSSESNLANNLAVVATPKLL